MKYSQHIAHGHSDSAQNGKQHAPVKAKPLGRAKSDKEDTENNSKARSFTGYREIGGNRCRCTLINIRYPHLERKTGNLETETGSKKHHAQKQSWIIQKTGTRHTLNKLSYTHQASITGKAENQSHTIEEHRRGDSA